MPQVYNAKGGRPRKHCSNACRTRHYRLRKEREEREARGGW